MENPTLLANLINKGIANEKEQGDALKAMQVALSSNLVVGMQKLAENITRFNQVIESATNSFVDRFSVEIESEAVPTSRLFDFITQMQSKQVQILDLYRKIIQGKELFNEVKSENERVVSEVLLSLKTDKDKQEFISLCERYLNERS